MDFRFESRLYDEYLHQVIKDHFTNAPNGDLFKFFGTHFFHDGTIHSIELADNPFGVRMVIDSLGISKKSLNGDFESIGRVKFVCTFSRVTKFLRESIQPGSPESMSFVESQIYANSTNESPSESKNSNYTLIIRAEFDETVWFKIDFDWVDVSPFEPLAFSQIESDENYQVHTFRFNA